MSSASYQQQDPYWWLKTGLVEDLATQADCSLAQFQQTFLEEFGAPASAELIRLFTSLAAGAAVEKQAEPVTEAAFVQQFASDEAATVLKFRQAFAKEYGQPPSEKIVGLFLRNLASRECILPSVSADEQSMREFAAAFAARRGSTVLAFRKEFAQRFQQAPTAEIIGLFLSVLATHGSGPAMPPGDRNLSSTERFTQQMAAEGGATVQKFRLAYQQRYGAAPDNRLISLFIKQLRP